MDNEKTPQPSSGPPNNSLWMLLLIAAFSGLIGNIVTVFGPQFLQYGMVPSFVGSPVFKKLSEQYPAIVHRLNDVFYMPHVFYSHRTADLHFKEIKKGKLIRNLKQETEVANPFNERITYRLQVQASDEARFISLKYTDETGNTKEFSEAELKARTMKGPTGVTQTPLDIHLQPHKSITVNTEHEFTTSLKDNDILVTNETILKYYKIAISVEKSLANDLIYDVQSLSFQERPTISKSQGSGQEVTLDGPIFPGQGLNIFWDVPPKK